MTENLLHDLKTKRAAGAGNMITHMVMDEAHAEITRLRAELETATARIKALEAERLYIVGWNHGYAEAEYQQKHGQPSEGDNPHKWVYTAAEYDAAKKEAWDAVRAIVASRVDWHATTVRDDLLLAIDMIGGAA